MFKTVYFSTKSCNTHRFVSKVGCDAYRIPIDQETPIEVMNTPYILFVASYSNNRGDGAIHPRVMDFLENENNVNNLKGIIGSGNRNFGNNFCLAATILSKRFDVPILYKYELLGTSEDVYVVQDILKSFT